MAQRRMFSNTITDSDLFMDMPKSAQLLYFHLNMHADDDGFVGNTKSIMRMTGSSDDDLKILLAKQYLIPFENGVTVIKDWHIHNYIRSDRKHPTKYTSELKQLELNEDASYSKLPIGSQVSANCQPNDGHLVGNCHTEVRLGKDSIGKDSINNKGGKSSRFIPPTVEEVREYCLERGNNVDAQCFVDFYSSKGWYVGKSKMKDWKASVRTWEKRRQVDSNNLQADRNELGEWLNA